MQVSSYRHPSPTPHKFARAADGLERGHVQGFNEEIEVAYESHRPIG
jgi:hypothetical protein